MSVAFWSNLCFALFLWSLIILFNSQIADMVGNPGKGHLLVITGVVIPIYSMIGIQTCKLKKELNFKKLFYVRIASAFVPLIITIPLALLGLDYWALIIGNIMGVVVNFAVLLAVKSFTPMFHFSWVELIEMLSYGIWTLLNGIVTWLTSWIDAFLIGKYLTDYYLGLYKNSANLIISIFTIVTASIVPVLFSSLSKLQDDDIMFRKMFLGIQRAVAIFLIPMGFILALYGNFVTAVLLGNKWKEAVEIISILSLATALRTVFISLNGDVFRAKGYFKIPLFLGLLDLVIIVPFCYYALQQDFWIFVYTRATLSVFLAIPESYYLWKKCNITFPSVFKNTWKFFFASIIMTLVAFILKNISSSLFWDMFCIFLCMLVYVGILCLFKQERLELIGYARLFLNKTKFFHKRIIQ